jgi:hypothetical protein
MGETDSPIENPLLSAVSELLARSPPIEQPVTVWKRLPCSAGPIRLVVGFLRIVLVVENAPGWGWWHVLDYFPLRGDDRDLLRTVEEMRRMGHNAFKDRVRIQGDLSPAVFSPLGAKDPEAREAMERLGGRGLEISNDITAIVDPELLRLLDGRRPRRARR